MGREKGIERVSSRFIFDRVCVFSIQWTRLSRSLEQAKRTPKNVCDGGYSGHGRKVMYIPRSKRFRLVSEQRKTEKRGFSTFSVLAERG